MTSDREVAGAVQRPADEDRADAERYRYLRLRGACNSKRTGLEIGTPLKALLAFRYWIEPEALDMLITAAIHGRADGNSPLPAGRRTAQPKRSVK